MPVKLTFNGRDVSPQQFADELKKEILKSAEDEIIKAAKRAAQGKGRLEVVRIERAPDGSVRKVHFSGDEAAVEAAQRALQD